MAGVQTYKLGDWKLQSGQSIPDTHIAYKTFGDPTSPAIIYPSWYSGCTLPSLSRTFADDYFKRLRTTNGSSEKTKH
jgi:homoserine acetyltransferase